MSTTYRVTTDLTFDDLLGKLPEIIDKYVVDVDATLD